MSKITQPPKRQFFPGDPLNERIAEELSYRMHPESGYSTDERTFTFIVSEALNQYFDRLEAERTGKAPE